VPGKWFISDTQYVPLALTRPRTVKDDSGKLKIDQKICEAKETEIERRMPLSIKGSRSLSHAVPFVEFTQIEINKE
jgi:hypothetical protein